MTTAAAAHEFIITLANHFTEDMCRNIQPSINKYAPSTASFFRGKLIEAYRADNQLFDNINSVAKYAFPGIAAIALFTSGPFTTITYLTIGTCAQGVLFFTEKVIKFLANNNTNAQTPYEDVILPTLYNTTNRGRLF